MAKSLASLFNLKTVVGLYIGSETVDLVILKGTLGGVKVVKFAQTSIYPKGEAKEEIVPQLGEGSNPTEMPQKKTKDEHIIEAIKRIFKENNVKPTKVFTAISSEEVMSRYFQMPKIPKQEWKQAISFEAKRYIPFRMEDIISDFQVVPSSGSGDIMDVVYVAAKKQEVERLGQLLLAAGVESFILEPAPFSFMRALSAAGQIDFKINTLIIDIGSAKATIIILKKGLPYIVRDIPLSEPISEQKELDPIFERLLSEVKLTFDFYEKQFPSDVIDKVIIYSHVPLENWHELVGKELQIPVEAGDPLRGIKIKKDVVPPQLALSFGLALRGLSIPYLEVNLFKERMLLFKKKELFLRMVFLEASAAILILVILRVISINALRPYTQEHEKTFSERPKVEVSIKTEDLDELERIKNEMQEKKFSLSNLLSKRTYVTTRFMDLVEALPDNIWLTEFDFEEKTNKKDITKVTRELNIKGYTLIEGKLSETDMVNNFLTTLKKSKAISEGMSASDIVTVKRENLEGADVASFQIRFSGP